MAIRIEVPDKPQLSQRQFIVDRLDAYNDAQTGPEPDRALCVLLHSNDAVVGGLWGRTYYRWLFIEQFFVPEELRGRGLGSELLTKAEQEALERGCHGVWLETFT
ncbi:MAG TPA: GNAT family N-acetyltransferase, partial [Alphaproteobacteria bacterium]